MGVGGGETALACEQGGRFAGCGDASVLQRPETNDVVCRLGMSREVHLRGGTEGRCGRAGM